MGAGQSIPSTLTREKVFELTKNNRSLMNVLLEYMMKELTVRDFLALSNPTECKKYVIYMANTLSKYFYELQIMPSKDKKGIIAFRPVKELVNPPETETGERQYLCLTLAYFYTRIFQIYGSLALTLIDDAKYMVDGGILPAYTDAIQKGLMPPGYRPYSSFSGGADSIPELYKNLRSFYFLNTFLVDSKEGGRGYETIYSGTGESSGTVYFNTEASYKEDEEGRSKYDIQLNIQKGIFYIGYLGAKKFASLDVIAKPEAIGSGKTILQFGKLKYYKKSSAELNTIDLPSSIIPNKTLLITSSQPGGPKTRKIFSISLQPENDRKTIAEYFNDIFERLIPYIKKLVEGEIAPTNISTTTEVGTPEELRLFKIINNLTKTKPLGHCMARALQLLKTLPFKDQSAISYVCKAKFLEQTTTTPAGTKMYISRSGLPEPGQSLDTSPGMSALSQLFYDTIQQASPKLMIGETPVPPNKTSSLEQYIKFMITMANVFGDSEYLSSISVDKIQKEGLKGIKNRRDSKLCMNPNKPGEKIDGSIIVPPSAVKKVYNIVNQLFRIQIEHANKCGNIFKMLFNINKDKTTGFLRISLSDTIIKKGIPEIERINYLTRDVLIQYYTNCEIKYLYGMKEVIDASYPKLPRKKPIVASDTTSSGQGASAGK
jgi:hypothetical protein